MNLVEVYIKEVHEVKEIVVDWGSCIMVDMTTNCYGRIERGKHTFSNMEVWEHIKEQGYYMG